MNRLGAERRADHKRSSTGAARCRQPSLSKRRTWTESRPGGHYLCPQLRPRRRRHTLNSLVNVSDQQSGLDQLDVGEVSVADGGDAFPEQFV